MSRSITEMNLSGRITPTPRNGLVDAVYDELTRLIFTGELDMESKLTEQGLADLLGVSRTPLRESLRRLQSRGMIDRHAGGGYRVAKWDEARLWELTSWRGALEGLAMRLAAPRITNGDLENLQDIIDQMEVFSRRDRYDTLIGLDIKFHETIWTCSGHHRLLQALEETKLQIQYVMLITRPGDEYRYPEMHTQLRDALATRDPEIAEQAMRSHVADTDAMAKTRLSEAADDDAKSLIGGLK